MNISRQQWLTETTEYKIIAWEHENDVTIDGVPLGEAIASDTELLEDACRWMNTRDFSMLSLRRRRTWLSQQTDNWIISDEAIPSGFLIPDSVTGGMQEITVTPESERRAEEEMVNMRDLSLYYNGTINYADGKLCKIIGHTEKGMICRPVNGGKSFVTKDLKPFNNVVTGLVNTPTGCVSCFRKPTRTAKEGINTESMDIGMGIAPWDNYPEEFMDMINNKYPSKEEAVEIAKRDGINVAISKFKYYDVLSNKFVNVLNKRGKQERKRYELD